MPITATLSIVDYAEKLGFVNCEWTRSASSESAYVTGTNPSDDVGFKIRISNHVLPPSYSYTIGDANYECTPREKDFHDMSQGTMIDAVVWLAKRIDAPVPPAIKGAITRRDKKKNALKVRIQTSQELHRKRIEAIEATEAAAMKWAEENDLDAYKAFKLIYVEPGENLSIYDEPVEKLSKNRRSKIRKKLSKLRSIIVQKYLEAHPL